MGNIILPIIYALLISSYTWWSMLTCISNWTIRRNCSLRGPGMGLIIPRTPLFDITHYPVSGALPWWGANYRWERVMKRKKKDGEERREDGRREDPGFRASRKEMLIPDHLTQGINNKNKTKTKQNRKRQWRQSEDEIKNKYVRIITVITWPHVYQGHLSWPHIYHVSAGV